jgi:putative OPT family oligopeptide transporter
MPYVPDDVQQAELTVRAVVLGSILGIVFGAASVYLGLRVGLTTSASIPIAVMSITILKKLGRSTILENNIVQTTGSAGESVAAAVVFTVPALIFLGFPMRVPITFLIAITGGILGVLMMIPLRRYLIVKEHGVLRFPEGTACAEILIAGEKGGTSAKKIFQGIGIGAAFKFATTLFGLFKVRVVRELGFYRGARLECETSPELLAVGYIIGYETSVIMVAGGLLSTLILAPMVVFFGSQLTTPLAPAAATIRELGFDGIYKNYIRYIGAGAVAAGGVLGHVRAAPAIWDSLTASLKQLKGTLGTSGGAVRRTERDTPITWVLGGSLAIVLFIALVPVFRMNVIGAILIVIFGFLFSVVSARITGLVGSSSCPISGMTIAALIGTCLIFLAVGWSGSAYSYVALVVGAVVCIALSNAGTTAQDLKTGHLVGATPRAQQLAILIGVLTSVAAVGWTTYALNASRAKTQALAAPVKLGATTVGGTDTVKGPDGQTYRFTRVAGGDASGLEAGNYLVDADNNARFRRTDGIGSKDFPAPQASLMAVLINGLLDRKLPWDLVLIGVAIALFIELMVGHSLTFAVGVYLPLSTTMPIFIGGVVRKLADRFYKRVPDDPAESEGTLFSSGLIAGGALVGVLVALLHFDVFGLPFDEDLDLPTNLALGPKFWPGLFNSDLVPLIAFAALGYLLFRGAREREA